jgi:hypothetical protein
MPDPNNRVGPALTDDAHWAKFLRQLRLLSIDDSIIEQLAGFRQDALAIDGLDSFLKADRGEVRLTYDDVSERFFLDWYNGATLREALWELLRANPGQSGASK